MTRMKQMLSTIIRVALGQQDNKTFHSVATAETGPTAPQVGAKALRRGADRFDRNCPYLKFAVPCKPSAQVGERKLRQSVRRGEFHELLAERENGMISA